MGQPMINIGTKEDTTKTGFKQTLTRYQALHCTRCPMPGACYKAKGNRIIERNYNLLRLTKQARELLLSEDGIAHRKRRCWDIEAVFANIKQNMNFRRFMLRGLEKLTIETGLLAMAHHLKKFSTNPGLAISKKIVFLF